MEQSAEEWFAHAYNILGIFQQIYDREKNGSHTPDIIEFELTSEIFLPRHRQLETECHTMTLPQCICANCGSSNSWTETLFAPSYTFCLNEYCEWEHGD